MVSQEEQWLVWTKPMDSAWLLVVSYFCCSICSETERLDDGVYYEGVRISAGTDEILVNAEIPKRALSIWDFL